jgi:hypothetical protein
MATMERGSVGEPGRCNEVSHRIKSRSVSAKRTPSRGSSAIEGAHHAKGAAIDDVGVDRPDRVVHCSLHGRLVQVVEDEVARRRVGAGLRGREDVLPGEALRRAEHLGAKRVREVHLAPAGFELGLMSPGDLVELGAEAIAELCRQERGAIVGASSPANEDLPALEVDILDPEPEGEALEEAKAAATEDLADQAEGRLQRFEERDHVPPGEDGREVLGALGTFEAFQGRHLQVEDALFEEEDRAEGLVLDRGRGLAWDGRREARAAYIVLSTRRGRLLRGAGRFSRGGGVGLGTGTRRGWEIPEVRGEKVALSRICRGSTAGGRGREGGLIPDLQGFGCQRPEVRGKRGAS